MAWPFSNPSIAPNFDTGQFATAGSLVAVPLIGGGTLGIGTPIWLMGISLENTSGADLSVTFTDGSGASIWTVDLPSKTALDRSFGFRPLTGLKANIPTGVNAHAWGYQ